MAGERRWEVEERNVFGAPLEPCGARTVRDHEGDPRVQAARLDGVDQGAQVAAPPRDENAEVSGLGARRAGGGI